MMMRHLMTLRHPVVLRLRTACILLLVLHPVYVCSNVSVVCSTECIVVCSVVWCVGRRLVRLAYSGSLLQNIVCFIGLFCKKDL